MMTEFSGRLREAAAGTTAGIFLAEVDQAGACFTLHVHAGADVARARREVVAATTAMGIDIDVRVRAHKVGDIAAPRSIEYWLGVFASGSVVFDPTLVAQRARMLLEAARACRREFGKRVGGVYFDSQRRAMHVVMSDAADSLALQNRILAMVGDMGSAGQPWPFVVRVASSTPRGDLTPVDAASAPFHRRLARTVRRALLPGAVVLAVTSLAMPASASNRDANSATSLVSHYGVLYSLSVFSDDQTRATGGAFTALGLQAFFGDQSGGALGPNTRVAQTDRRTIVRDVAPDSAPGGGGSASPGS